MFLGLNIDENTQSVEALFCATEDVGVSATTVSGETQADLPCSEEISIPDDESQECYIPGLFLRSCLVPLNVDATQIKFTLSVPSCDCESITPCEIPESIINVSPQVPDTCTPMMDFAVANGEAALQDGCSQKYTGVCQKEVAEECLLRKENALKTMNNTCSAQLVQNKENCTAQSNASQADLMEQKNATVVKIYEECQVKVQEACSINFFLSLLVAPI